MSMISTKHDIEWNGRSLRFLAENHGFQLLITKLPDLNRATRKYERYSVPGKNGDIIIPQDAWENVTLTYEIMIGNGDRNTAPEAARLLAKWLSYTPIPQRTITTISQMIDNGYHRLADTFDHGYERRAVLMEGYNIESKFTKYAYATVSFNCRPERFVTQGLQYQSFEDGVVSNISNTYSFSAKPFVRFVKTLDTESDWYFVCGGATCDLNMENVAELYVDSENEECYFGSAALANERLSLRQGKFPVIRGSSVVGSVNGKMYIMPRWWCL